MAAYRDLEIKIENVFILYTLGKKSCSGRKPKCFLQPKSFSHARDLVKADNNFLDWMNDETVVKRAERFFADGGPVKTTFTSLRVEIRDLKAVRNHLVHNSDESLKSYQKVLRRIYTTVPLNKKTVGSMLNDVPSGASQYMLKKYFSDMRRIVDGLCL